MTALSELWVYLSREPLAALTATLCAWWVALRAQHWARAHPLANPVLLAVAMLAAFACVIGGGYLLVKRRQRLKGVLMLVMAAVLVGNVLIWTM